MSRALVGLTATPHGEHPRFAGWYLRMNGLTEMVSDKMDMLPD
jgi:hypothetical protein